MNQPHDTFSASAELIAGLTEVLRIAVADQFPATRADVEDIEQLLDALHAMRPDVVELRMFDGFLHVIRADWHAAIETFTGLVEDGRCLSGSKAMLAYCKDATADVSWRQLALELLDDPQAGPQAHMLAQALIARNDMEDARLIALRTGNFSEPESLRALRAQDAALSDAHPASAPASAGGVDAQYLRL